MSIGREMRGHAGTLVSCVGLSLGLVFGAAAASEAAGTAQGIMLRSSRAPLCAAPLRFAENGDLFVISANDAEPSDPEVADTDALVSAIASPSAAAMKTGSVPVDAKDSTDSAAAVQIASAVGGRETTASSRNDAKALTKVAATATGSAAVEPETRAVAFEAAPSGAAMKESDLRAAADGEPAEAAAVYDALDHADTESETEPEQFVEAVRKETLPPAQPPAKESAKPQPEVAIAQAAPATPAGAAANPSKAKATPRLAENPSVPSTFDRERGKAGIMRVLAGKSLMMDLNRTVKRVSVANPEVAEVLVISPRQVMINGLANGETSIIVWDSEGNYTMNSLVVGDQLQDQVMLEVTVAEINRTAAERHGVDVRALGGQFGTVTNFGNAAPVSGKFPPQAGDPPFPFGLDGGISWAVVDFKNDIAVFFKQLQEENLGRVLAEPKLLARSGKEANFLSGGEIPIVITQQQNTTIEFKEFGTKIKFVPEVREDGTIDLKVQSEVSEPDFANGVDLFGFRVPAFVTRRVDTDVTLRTAESLVVAGLIKETKQEIESKLPFMGDIPLFGYFFRSTEFSKDMLELVIVVKPKIVGAIPAGEKVPLPTDRGPLTRKEVRTKDEPEKVSRPRPY